MAKLLLSRVNLVWSERSCGFCSLWSVECSVLAVFLLGLSSRERPSINKSRNPGSEDLLQNTSVKINKSRTTSAYENRA